MMLIVLLRRGQSWHGKREHCSNSKNA